MQLLVLGSFYDIIVESVSVERKRDELTRILGHSLVCACAGLGMGTGFPSGESGIGG
jgi:hypothetical protein